MSDGAMAPAGLSDRRSNPNFDSAFVRFASSDEGTEASAYGSRISEWERRKRQASGTADDELTWRAPRPNTIRRLNLGYPPTPKYAAKHAEIAVALAKNLDQVLLDYSPQSLRTIDRIIRRFYRDGRTEDQMAETIFCFGCYAGEVLARATQGRWREAGDVVPEKLLQFYPFMVIELPNGTVWSPIAKAFKQLANGSEDSLEYLFRAATADP